ncbi:MAG: Mov34/MPN/PAD-1 family protein [Candidatus Helarchaeota archaeon]
MSEKKDKKNEKKEEKKEEKKIEKKEEKKIEKKEPSDFQEKGMVRISFDAYLTIILHACRFANAKLPMDAWKEIYGFLVGKLDGDDVIVEMAVPMAHGSSVEVEFDDEHYIKSAQIDSMAAERGQFMVGWYHSHPGLGLFLSNTDIKNHLGYQGPNPKAIALVFDHTKLNPPDHPGFDIFKLDDPNLGTMSDFHEVKYEIEDIDYKKFAQALTSLTERSVSRLPLIAEFGEEGTIFGGAEQTQDSSMASVSTTPLGEIRITVPALNVDPVLEGFAQGFKAMLQEILPSMFSSFADQTQAIASAFQELGNRQVKAMNDLQELLSIGIGEVRTQIIKKIEESHEGLINVSATNFQNLTEIVEKTADDVSDMEDRIIDDVGKTKDEISEKISISNSEFHDEIGKELDSMKGDVEDMEKEIVDKINLHIDSVTEELSKIIEMKVSDSLKGFNKAITKRLNELDEKLDKLGEKPQ